MKPSTKVILALIILLSCHLNSSAQVMSDWSDQEKSYYKTITDFNNYIQKNPATGIRIDTVTEKWVLFDYVLQDSSATRKQRRIKKLETLLHSEKHFIDSVGLANLETRPLRYYKSSKEVMDKFSGNPDIPIDQIFAYFKKGNPDKPLGYLYFDKKTSKLISWLLLKQGGLYYFLTFSIL